MTGSEFDDWQEFYNRHPFDDRERFHRPAALVAHAMGGAKMEDLLKWLSHELPPDEGATDEVLEDGQLSTADLNTIASLGIKPPKHKLRPKAPKQED